jgi:hypothetical protein
LSVWFFSGDCKFEASLSYKAKPCLKKRLHLCEGLANSKCYIY